MLLCLHLLGNFLIAYCTHNIGHVYLQLDATVMYKAGRLVVSQTEADRTSAERGQMERYVQEGWLPPSQGKVKINVFFVNGCPDQFARTSTYCETLKVTIGQHNPQWPQNL